MTYARVDANQTAIVSALRKIGASVAVTSPVGDGFTDLVVGYRGTNYLLECKDGKKRPSDRKLTPAQVKFHAAWRGAIHVVESVEQAIQIITKGE